MNLVVQAHIYSQKSKLLGGATCTIKSLLLDLLSFVPARFTIQMLSDPPGSECKRGVFRAFPHRCTRTAGTAPPADTRACTDEQTVDKSMRGHGRKAKS